VELTLNGTSLGAKLIDPQAAARIWKVPFEPGVIKAVGSNSGGAVAATCELRTAGKPAGLVLAADETSIAPTWDDIAYVRASVVDDHGTVVPNADNPIRFAITGPGVIAAVDSADTSSHEAFR